MKLPLNNFLNLPPDACEAAKARYAVLPVPYEGTVTFLKGTAAAPAAIINASTQVEEFDEELGRDFRAAGIVTLPAILPAETPAAQMRRVALTARAAMDGGKFILTLGGEHSITAPLVQAVAEQYGEISVLQIDAHADLRDTYEGSPHSHACVMRRGTGSHGSSCPGRHSKLLEGGVPRLSAAGGEIHHASNGRKPP